MMTPYKGMRWLKCDLQVQTPEDSRHWLDQDLKLLEPRRQKVDGQPNESDIQDKARKFLRRCYELELELIGITDHNFSALTDPRDWFAVHLIEQNKTVAKEFGREPIYILPGFEVDIGYHMLCLFAPAKKQRDFEQCNRILTKLGMAEDARFDQGVPKQLRHNDQRVSLKKLIEIVQVEHHGIVIAAHADQDRGFFSDAANKEDYSNLGLYCVELTQNPPAQKHQEILVGRNETWKRKHSHPAWIMSSDAKSIRQENNQPIANSLGYRFSWIKMSEPSVEALRQAFLDHESRIAIPINFANDIHPGLKSNHSRVVSIKLRNVSFLKDQEIHFSPNLNCVIGGRGSGKSTALEYLRILFGKDNPQDLDEGTKSRIKRIHGTLTKDSEIEVSWLTADGVKDTFVWRNGGKSVEGLELSDPKTFYDNLSIQFFSQQQLNRLTDVELEEGGERQAERLLDLIDGFAAKELKALGHEEIEIRRQVEESFAAIRNADELESYLLKNQQEKQELDRQYNARQEIQNDLERFQQLSDEIKFLDTLYGQPGLTETDIQDLANQFLDNHPDLTIGESPNKNWLEEYGNKIKAAKQKLADAVKDAINIYNQELLSIKQADVEWPQVEVMHNSAAEVFRKACENKGLTPEDLGRLEEINAQRIEKQTEIDKLTNEIKELKKEAGDPEALMRQLHDVWLRQFNKRQEASDRANELAILSDGEQRFIEVTARYQSNKKSFKKIWNGFNVNDGRSKLGRSWEQLGEEIFNFFCQQNEQISPWQIIKDALDGAPQLSVQRYGEVWFDFVKYVGSKPREWSKVRCSRVKEAVDFKLFRPDGTEAGSISEGTLSDGQRNTAALALLLAQDGGPLVIDQPEDELDSNFVFRELIPMLRKVKSKRQLIMATHNANLPVNGDAELVYAFEARDGKGEVLACGGLDQASVTKAVLDIMEGTEEAFRRRREKYHF